MNEISILGAGAWGTAVATLLAENGYTVNLWCHEDAVAQDIITNGINTVYLPNIVLSKLIKPTTDLKVIFNKKNSWIFIAVPIKFLRSVLQSAKPYFLDDYTFVMLSKGIENDTLMLPTKIVEDVVGKSCKSAVLSGPSFAADLANKQFSAVTLGAHDHKTALALQKITTNSYFKSEISSDLIGMQTGAALKNVIALAVGILQGAHKAQNTQALIITMGLNELVSVATKLGGNAQTIYGLSGVGDLILTCMSQQSKNVQAGKLIGQGQTIDQLIAKGINPEGFNTVQSMCQLAQKENLDLPICRGVYQMLFEQKTVIDFLEEIFDQKI